jgi:hypothetical protein
MENDVRLVIKINGELGVQLVECTRGELFNLKFSNNRFAELGGTFYNKEQMLWFKEEDHGE